MNEIQSAIIEAIKTINDESSKNLKFDYTKQGKILSISEDKKTCDVQIDGETYICKIRDGLIASIGDNVLVKIPSNNFSSKIVDSKIGTLGAIDVGTVTTHNHNDIYYTKSEVDAKNSTYIHNQISPNSTWTITHNLNKFPSITIVDSGGNVVIGDIKYNSENEVILTFTSSFSGIAYLN